MENGYAGNPVGIARSMARGEWQICPCCPRSSVDGRVRSTASWREKAVRITLFAVACTAVLTGCSPVSTRWHTEPVTDTSVSMNGSYRNAIESLVVKSHEWKITAFTGQRGR